jgi:phage regulator Rha-like protein
LDPVETFNPLKKKVRLNGKDVTDREDLNTFLKEKIEEINSYLETLYNSPENVTPTAVEEDTNLESELDDVEKNPVIAEKSKAKKKKDLADDDLPF